MLLPCTQVDEEVLVGIVVVHVHRHVKVQPAEQIDRLHKGAEIDKRVAVRQEADDVFHLLHELFHALLPAADRAVGRVDLRHNVGRGVGVARDAQKTDAALVPVERQEEDRVGARAVLVRAAEKDRAPPRNAVEVIRVSHRRLADKHRRKNCEQHECNKKAEKASLAAALLLFRLLPRRRRGGRRILGGIGDVLLFLLRLVHGIFCVFFAVFVVAVSVVAVRPVPVRLPRLALTLRVVGVALRIVSVPAGVVGVAFGIVFLPRFRGEMPPRSGILLRWGVPVGKIVLLRRAVPVGGGSVCMIALFHGVLS